MAAALKFLCYPLFATRCSGSLHNTQSSLTSIANALNKVSRGSKRNFAFSRANNRTDMAPRILIFGTGSIGGAYAYVLSRAVSASNIVTVCRSNYDAALARGFTINSTIWGNDLNVKPIVARTVEDAVAKEPSASFDYVIVCSKALPTKPSTAELIKPAISKDTAIVLIQNGIGIEDNFSELYPNNPLLSTVVYLPVTQTSPGVIEHREVELLHIGTYPSNAPSSHKSAAKAFNDLITSANASAKLHDNIQPQRWSKVLVNASWNPICALSRSRDAQFIHASRDDSLQLINDVMTEIANVAQACGYKDINKGTVDFQIGRAARRDLPGIEPSMLADALAGRSLEVDAIVGNVIAVAKEKGVHTPLLNSIYLLTVALNDSFTRTKQ